MINQQIYKASEKTIKKACGLLKSGELVSFPTETVYGLGADATNGLAIAKIFAAKNRPQFNPLIVHISSQKEAQQYVKMNDLAKILADAFWPGPFTMVLPLLKNNPLSELITAGLDTVAVRVPKNTTAHNLLQQFGGPIAAPSANISGQISPTTAQHVASEFGHELQMIIDGGPCEKGIESTIIQVTKDQVILLRPGNITTQDIEKIIHRKVFMVKNDGHKPNSPGQLKSHYAPKTPIRLNISEPKDDECLLAFGDVQISDDTYMLNLSENGDLKDAAANLFSMLRSLDKMNFSSIAVSPIPNIGLGIAINDRLGRAAAPKDEN